MQTGDDRLPIGIDLGNFSCKVAALGRTGTQVLPNSLSNRETPTLVSLGGGRRLVGEAATTQRNSNVTGTLWNIRALLGRVTATDNGADAVSALGEQPYVSWQGFQIVATTDGGLATVGGQTFVRRRFYYRSSCWLRSSDRTCGNCYAVQNLYKFTILCHRGSRCRR